MTTRIPANQDHPRGCGENMSLRPRQAIGLGSPPRMRGKHDTAHIAVIYTGITPADAGKTCGYDAAEFVSEDHPRGCGENLTAPIS